MQFDWKNPKDDIHVCNDGAGQVEPGKQPGTYRAMVFSDSKLVDDLDGCSGLHAAKRLVETKLEQRSSATAAG